MTLPGGQGGTKRVPRDAGGPPSMPRVYSNQSVTVDRTRGNSNDSQIIKDKTPWMHKGYSIPAPTGPADFDQNSCGPARAELHLRTLTIRREAGAFNSDTTGMHTVVPKVRSNLGSRKPNVMVSGRQSRLTTVIFRGQTYSETTLQQGAKNRNG